MTTWAFSFFLFFLTSVGDKIILGYNVGMGKGSSCVPEGLRAASGAGLTVQGSSQHVVFPARNFFSLVVQLTNV